MASRDQTRVVDGRCAIWSVIDQSGEDLYSWILLHPIPSLPQGVADGDPMGRVAFDRRSQVIQARTTDGLQTLDTDDGVQALRMLHLRYHRDDLI